MDPAPSVLISVIALAVSIYGVYERQSAASNIERIRLSTIVDDLNKIRRDTMEEARELGNVGDHIEVLNARSELLSQQALALINRHHLDITSTELRAIAAALESSGFLDDADDIWRVALDTAKPEGTVQEIFAFRGYAYFSFRQNHPSRARELLNEALQLIDVDCDRSRVRKAETLTHWATWEASRNGVESQEFLEKIEQIEALISQCENQSTKEFIQRLLPPPNTASHNPAANHRCRPAILAFMTRWAPFSSCSGVPRTGDDRTERRRP